jgi:hypothetical protein
VGELQYTREQLEGFFSWKMETCLKHFDHENNAEEIAKAFAFQFPDVDGFITFKSEYRGRRFFWIANGTSAELDAMDCYFKATGKDEEISNEPKIEPDDPKTRVKRRLQEMILKGRERDE